MDHNTSTQNTSAEEHSPDELLEKLKNTDSISGFLYEHRDCFNRKGIGAYLQERIQESNITKASLARNAGMSEIYLYQILSERRHPSRDRVICIGISMSYSLDQIQELLYTHGYAKLYIKNRRDAIIMHGILHNRNLFALNDILFTENEGTLS